MRKMKKLVSLVLALVLAFALAAPAFAATGPFIYSGEDATTDGKITVTNVTLGKDYTLYKIFDATYDGDAVSYTVSTGDYWLTQIQNDAENTPFTLTSNDNALYYVTLKENVEDSAVFAWLTSKISNATEISTITPDKDHPEVEWQNIPYGYYYITSSLGTAVTVNTAKPTVEVIDKNQEPGNLVKTATDGVSVDDEKFKSAQIGDVVDFEITYTATNYDGDKKIVEYYVDDDMPDGFDLVTDSIAVKVGDATVTDGCTITYGSEDTDDFKVTIPWVDDAGDSKYESPTTITVSYKATMNANAVIDGAGNTNTATITHKNDDGSTPDPDPDKDTDTETVYTYALAIKKVDTKGQPLAGAEFTLKQGDTEVKVSGNNGVYTVDPDGSSATVVSPESGVIIIKGVEGVEYTLTETKAPSGYNLLTEPVKVTPVKTGETTTTVTKYIDEKGDVVDTETNVEVKVENNDVAATVMVVVNFTGAQLPSTGGIGTTIFYVVGGILVVGAAILLVTRKRVSGEK